MKTNLAVIGAAGYTGGELLRLLLEHPMVGEIQAISRSQGETSVSAVHEDLFAYDLKFTSELKKTDLVFLCGDHGQSETLLRDYDLETKAQYIIDLAHDFRDGREGFVYGLSEVYSEAIMQAKRVANPGCFATAIQLALAPLASKGWLRSEVHVTAITGSTGAGQKLQKTSHFSNRQQNLGTYKAFSHQHLAEIDRTLSALKGSAAPALHFVPLRGPFTRGILASIVTDCDADDQEVFDAFETFYAGEKAGFVHITRDDVSLKTVVNTNHARLQVNKHEGKVHIVSCIDNLLKGASGQAVQNMNLMLGWPQASGLKLKPLAY